MIAYILRRLFQAALVIFGVACVVFLVLRIVPGDPARLMVPPGSSEEVVEVIRQRLGTDQPVLVQFGHFLLGLIRGDLGDSFRHGRPVIELILDRLPATLALTATTMTTAVLIAVPLGIIAAYYSGGVLDRAILILSLAGQSIPNFWLGVMLVLFFAIRLQWFPAIGMTGPASLVLPTVTLSLILIAILVRTVRQSMLEVLSEDYIRTVRAKGMSEAKVVLVHALKNASIPLITILGIQVGFVLGGAFVVEMIFDWPGIGLLALEAMRTRDFPVVQGVVIVVAVVFTLANLAVDIAYAYLNPRVRMGRGD